MEHDLSSFQSLVEKGVLLQLFTALKQSPDFEWEFIDGSIIRAHQHATGAATHECGSIGKNRGGNTTKIHLAVDSYGLPIDFLLTGGEVHDSKAAPELIARLPDADYVVAYKVTTVNLSGNRSGKRTVNQ